MNEPLIGYDNLVLPSQILAEYSDPEHPASNMGYATTDEFWRSSSTSEQSILITVAGQLGSVEIDYIALANQNLCRDGIALTAEVSEDGESWQTVFGPEVVGCRGPVIIQFGRVQASSVRITLNPDQVPPEIGVIYIGRLLRLPRRIYVGHTPIKYGRSANVVTGRSENGSFLGRIIKSESRSTQISMGNIPPGFYREHIDPWLQSALKSPFFFSWRPDTYPEETGYVWATNDPSMSNQRPNGMVEFSLRVNGIAY